MKIRRAIIGTTVLFSASCWGPADLKDGYTAEDAGTDGSVGVDTEPIGQDTGVSTDTGPRVDTNPSGDTAEPADTSACYERPADPTTLIGKACLAWEGAVECDDQGRIVAVCFEGAWADDVPVATNLGEVCSCSSETAVCSPPSAECEPTGVGFLGINVAGWDRTATRSLRRLV